MAKQATQHAATIAATVISLSSMSLRPIAKLPSQFVASMCDNYVAQESQITGIIANIPPAAVF
ncbi:hypothetical protein RTCIAT899_PC04110 (plasmid) [Rhizobium tropici CIAT 899]|nr:hypothetical protein RTCIAT899_PC04110 [Rhizobium tropici CIAT 899]